MDYRVSYEYSLKSESDAFITQVPSQLVQEVRGNIPHTLLPEHITDLTRRCIRLSVIAVFGICGSGVSHTIRTGIASPRNTGQFKCTQTVGWKSPTAPVHYQS